MFFSHKKLTVIEFILVAEILSIDEDEELVQYLATIFRMHSLSQMCLFDFFNSLLGF